MVGILYREKGGLGCFGFPLKGERCAHGIVGAPDIFTHFQPGIIVGGIKRETAAAAPHISYWTF